MFKRFISLLVAYSLICSYMLCATANADEYTFNKAENLPQQDMIFHAPDDEVMFIVEVEGDPLLAGADAVALSDEYLTSNTKEQKEDEIVANQMNVVNKIQEEISDVCEPDYVYTALFNGFAIEGKRSDEEKLLSIPGVKNVYISGNVEATPKLTSSVELSHALPEEISGYSGKGQAIAIIDNEFSYGHEMFLQTPDNPKYTRDDIAQIISNSNLKASVTTDQVYKSVKIPFAYDYVNRSSNTYSSEYNHGTHIAGIAGGNNGEGLLGVAPNAQLILMKVSNSSGNMPEYAILQALNDAALLGVCAINCSFGVDYTSVNTVSPAWQTSVNNAYSAGIYISAAASNSSKGFYNNSVLTENIDYSASAVPATISSVTAVASSINSSKVFAYSNAVLSDSENIKLMQYYINQSFTALIGPDGVDCVDCGYGLEGDFPDDASGKIALIRRGQASFLDMASNAQNAGAVGLIIINTTDEYNAFSDLSFPAALVTNSDGEKLLKSGRIISATAFTKNIEISSFSSYCVDESLELKPDITAPGGNIYSSIPGDSYGTMSGTSMSAPHITGIVAIMNEYLDEIEYSGSKTRIEYINNLLMSTATVLKYTDTDIPYSPRVQGSGLVNTAAALSTPVILYGDTGRTKLSLMDNLSNTINISFTAENIADFDAVYDSVSVDVLTDSYKQADGENIVDKTRRLTARIDKPDTLTVTSKATKTVSIDITLDEAELLDNLEVFTNGFFIEGYVCLESSQENVPSVGIPFMGFYGDWTKAPVFDKTIYDEGGSLLVDQDNEVLGTFLSTQTSDDELTPLGYGKLNNEQFGYIKDYIAISPNNDGVSENLQLVLTPMRTMKNITITFSNENMTPLARYRINGYLNKFYTSIFDGLTYPQFLPDGNYYITVDSKYNYDTENPTAHSITLPFYVDTVSPEIINASIDENVIYVSGYDSKNINNILIELPDGNDYICYIPPEANGTTVNTCLPLDKDTVYDPSEIWITITDCAGNSYSNMLSCLDGKIQPKISSFAYDETGYSIDIDIINSEIQQDCTLILSFYDNFGHLICTELKENITVSGDSTIFFSQDSDISCASNCKLFVWDTLGNLSNLDTSKELNISSYMTK